MKRTTLLLTSLAVLTLVVTGCDHSPVHPGPDAAESVLVPDHADHSAHAAVDARGVPGDPAVLASIRQATARYQQYERALDDGFVPLSECVYVPGLGGMGIHYGRVDRVFDPAIRATEPEILLYEPMGNGRKRLVGVEYMVRQIDWEAAGNEGPPSVAGREFDPPNPFHPDALVAESYTLHVWTWRNNPAGMFTPFNPNVGC
jgi:hypothetical protein